MKYLFLPLVFIANLAFCQPVEPAVVGENKQVITVKLSEPEKYAVKYLLDKPDETFNMPSELFEISGLGFSNQYTQLCAVQDEDGKIFFIDKSTGLVKRVVDFWKDGDYEGVEVVGEKVFVVKSTGTIYEIDKVDQADQKVEKYNSFLGRQNDVEGLCYDGRNNRLLLACKGIPATGESLEALRFTKVIYSFDLETKTLDSLPAFTIKLEDFRGFIQENKLLDNRSELLNLFSKGSSDLNFNPSSIAIHPLTGNIYMTSSLGKVMVVINQKGVVQDMVKMDKSIHPQPEGIAFDKDGGMYISNEGKKAMAQIHYFKMKK